MLEVRFYDTVDDQLLKFAVIVSRYKGNGCSASIKTGYLWVPRRPSGNEQIIDAANGNCGKKLVQRYLICSQCVYSVYEDNEQAVKETFGMLYFARISSFGVLPPLRIERIELLEQLPERWTYPLIQPKLVRKVQKTLGERPNAEKERWSKLSNASSGWRAAFRFQMIWHTALLLALGVALGLLAKFLDELPAMNSLLLERLDLANFYLDFLLGSAGTLYFGIQPVAAACGDQRVLLFDRMLVGTIPIPFYQRFSKIVYHDLGHHDAVLPALAAVCWLAKGRSPSWSSSGILMVFPDGVAVGFLYFDIFSMPDVLMWLICIAVVLYQSPKWDRRMSVSAAQRRCYPGRGVCSGRICL